MFQGWWGPRNLNGGGGGVKKIIDSDHQSKYQMSIIDNHMFTLSNRTISTSLGCRLKIKINSSSSFIIFIFVVVGVYIQRKISNSLNLYSRVKWERERDKTKETTIDWLSWGIRMRRKVNKWDRNEEMFNLIIRIVCIYRQRLGERERVMLCWNGQASKRASEREKDHNSIIDRWPVSTPSLIMFGGKLFIKKICAREVDCEREEK